MLMQVYAEYPGQWMGVRAIWERGGTAYWLGGGQLTPMEMDDTETRGLGNKNDANCKYVTALIGCLLLYE